MAWTAAITQFQNEIDALAPLPIAYWSFNIVSSFLAALLSFLLFNWLEYKKERSIVEQMSFVNEQMAQINAPFIAFTVLYSLVSGLLAACWIQLQFGGANLTMAIFLGVIGPYAMKDRVLGEWQQTVSQQTKKKLSKDREEIKKRGDDSYDKVLQRVKEKIKGP